VQRRAWQPNLRADAPSTADWIVADLSDPAQVREADALDAAARLPEGASPSAPPLPPRPSAPPAVMERQGCEP